MKIGSFEKTVLSTSIACLCLLGLSQPAEAASPIAVLSSITGLKVQLAALVFVYLAVKILTTRSQNF